MCCLNFFRLQFHPHTLLSLRHAYPSTLSAGYNKLLVIYVISYLLSGRRIIGKRRLYLSLSQGIETFYPNRAAHLPLSLLSLFLCFPQHLAFAGPECSALSDRQTARLALENRRASHMGGLNDGFG